MPEQLNASTLPVSSTIGTWLLAIVRALDANGCSGNDILRKVGIDQSCLTDAHSRVGLDKMNKLWALAVEATGDETFGLEVARHTNPTTFHALVFAHLASSTLRETIERTVRFGEIINTSTRLELIETESETKLVFHLPKSDELQPSYQAIDAFAAVGFMSVDNLLESNERGLKALRLCRPAPKDVKRFEDLFRCKVTFNTPMNEFVFSNKLLDKPIPTANPELARMNEQILGDYLAKLKKDDIVNSVRIKITETMSNKEPSQESIAMDLGMSSRSLHRKLKEKGTSYKAILDDTRKHLALQLIKQSNVTITEIGYQLGFFDASSFSRSFKRWTGLSPTQHRKQQ